MTEMYEALIYMPDDTSSTISSVLAFRTEKNLSLLSFFIKKRMQ
jgi:hypothetical protein